MPFQLVPFLINMLIATAISYAISELMKKDIKPPAPTPADFDAPTTKEGVKYTINFGTNWIENPVVAWWGNIAISPIVRHYSVNKWFNNKRVYYVIGYHYAMGCHLILTQGQNDGIKQIRVDDIVAWPNPDDETALQADGATSATIDEPLLFGGEDSEGGIEGTVSFQYGASSQSPNTYLQGILGSDISATRGLTAAVLEQVRVGTSPYPKGWAFLIKRTDVLTDGSPQWYPGKAVLDTNDLNAAHILRECFTNMEWGLQHSTSLFPSVKWEAFADDLYDEGFGLSMKWEGQNQTLEDFIRDVLRHIDALIYEDPETGEFIPKLIRDDYVVASLDEYDDSDVLEVSDFTRGAYHHVPDTVWVEYWNRLDNVAVSIPDHDVALMNSQGGRMVSYETRYHGVMNDALAGKLVARERQQLGAFSATMKVKGKRTMSSLRPGDVFKLTWPTLGISQMVVRVLKINYGTLNDGYILIDCAEDVFATQTALYSTPPATGWTDPRNEPAAAPDRMVRETPFWDVYLDTGLTDTLALDDDSGFVRVAAKQPSSDAYDYELMLRDSPSDSFYSDGRGNFTPNGTLDSFLPLNAANATIDLIDAEGLYDVEVGTYAVIENEIVKVTAVDAANDQVTIARGCLDTVPEYHSGDDTGGGPGARIWFVGSVAYIAGREYIATDQPGVKILPRTPKGQFAEGSATAYNASAFDSRIHRPYPPGDFKINGVSYPSSFSGQPTISWAHRDRTQQLTEITEHSAASVGPEAGTTYTLQIYDEDNNLVRTESGLTGTSYTYSEMDEMSDCGIGTGEALNTQLRFVLKSVRSGYDSWQSYDITVPRV